MMPVNSSTTIGQPIWIPGLQLTACIYYSMVLLIGVTGNILVIVIVMKYRDMRNATNYLLTNLSVADLFFLLFCTPDGYQHLYGKDNHRLGKFMCSFVPFIQNATSICSVLTIMAISYERYVAICEPLRTSSLHLTVFRTLPTVIFFWFISCFISAPFYKYSTTKNATSIFNDSIITCSTPFPETWKTWYLILCTLIIYLVILILLCSWCYSICRVLFNREALLRDNTIVTRYRRQVVQLLIALIISFFTLILPFRILAFIFSQIDEKDLGFRAHSVLIIITRSLYYTNSAINPLLYSIMSTKFRQSFARLCHRCCKLSKDHQPSAVLFSKEQAKRPVSIDVKKGVAGGSMTAASRLSCQQSNTSQLHEKRLLLVENTPTTVTTSTTDTKNLLFPT